MNLRKLLPLLLCTAVFAGFAADEDSDNEPSKEPTKVKKLDGTSLFGIVEITDNYTIRIKSDTGIQNIPIAMLGEKDFLRFGFLTNRSEDGRFWSERKNAVEKSPPKNPGENETEEKPEEESADKKNSPSASPSALEINLAQFAPVQSLIDAYEKTLGGTLGNPLGGNKTSSSSSGTDEETGKVKNPEEAASGEKSGETPFVSLFSKPGIPSVPNPLGGIGSSVTQPVSTAVSTVTGGVPSVPGVPAGIPTMPSTSN